MKTKLLIEGAQLDTSTIRGEFDNISENITSIILDLCILSTKIATDNLTQKITQNTKISELSIKSLNASSYFADLITGLKNKPLTKFTFSSDVQNSNNAIFIIKNINAKCLDINLEITDDNIKDVLQAFKENTTIKSVENFTYTSSKDEEYKTAITETLSGNYTYLDSLMAQQPTGNPEQPQQPTGNPEQPQQPNNKPKQPQQPTSTTGFNKIALAALGLTIGCGASAYYYKDAIIEMLSSTALAEFTAMEAAKILIPAAIVVAALGYVASQHYNSQSV